MSHEHPHSDHNNLPDDDITHFLPDVDFSFFDGFRWRDPVWGQVNVENWSNEPRYRQLFCKLLVHPAIRRLIGVEQLTLPEQYETVPNTARFSRWEHITGSAAFASHLIDDWREIHPEDQIDERAKTIYLLRTMLSDVAHTVGSHLGDWIEGDASEQLHDQELREYLTRTGIGSLLKEYDISLDEVDITSVETQDFIECASPALCVDRVDYAIREIHRTNPYFHDPEHQFTKNDFSLYKDSDGTLQITMQDETKALLFAKAYELLSQENWSEPLHQLQTELYRMYVTLFVVELCKGTATSPVSSSEVPPLSANDNWNHEYERHPRDIMYYVESIFSRLIDGLPQGDNQSIEHTSLHALNSLMREISEIAKNYMRTDRNQEFVNFMNEIASGQTDADMRLRARPPLYFGTDYGDMELVSFSSNTPKNPEVLSSVALPKRKLRVVDPAVNGIPLSILGNYTPDATQSDSLSAYFILRDTDFSAIQATYERAKKKWQEFSNERPRMPDEQLQYIQTHVIVPLSSLDYGKFTIQKWG